MEPAEADGRSYILDLEEHLRQVVFDGNTVASSRAAVLLVRGAIASGDHARAAQLARATAALAKATPDDRDIAAAAAHVRGLVERGRAPIDNAARGRRDRPAFGWASLTDTERRIADLVAQGLSNREVGGRLFLSAHTVAFHLRRIFWKLGIGSRVQLARIVAEQAPALTT